MRKNLSIILFLFLCISVQCQTITQQLISSSGDKFKNSTYQLDWSVGEMTTEPFSGTNQIITQGFHQGYYTITAIDQISDLQFQINLFPNPTTDFIHLLIQTDDFKGIKYSMSDINGKILKNSNSIITDEQISMKNYPSGFYFFSVYRNNQLLKSFKIVKH